MMDFMEFIRETTKFLRDAQYLNGQTRQQETPYGLVVRTPGFHPGGRGSTPGVGTTFWGVSVSSGARGLLV